MNRLIVLGLCGVLCLPVASFAQEYREATTEDEYTTINEGPKRVIMQLAKECKADYSQDITGMAICMKKRQSEIDASVQEAKDKRHELSQQKAEKFFAEQKKRKEDQARQDRLDYEEYKAKKSLGGSQARTIN